MLFVCSTCLLHVCCFWVKSAVNAEMLDFRLGFLWFFSLFFPLWPWMRHFSEKQTHSTLLKTKTNCKRNKNKFNVYLLTMCHHHHFPPLLLVFMGWGNHVGGSSWETFSLYQVNEQISLVCREQSQLAAELSLLGQSIVLCCRDGVKFLFHPFTLHPPLSCVWPPLTVHCVISLRRFWNAHRNVCWRSLSARHSAKGAKDVVGVQPVPSVKIPQPPKKIKKNKKTITQICPTRAAAPAKLHTRVQS